MISVQRFSLIGDKWTVMIVMVLVVRPRRLNDLKRTIGGTSEQMLPRPPKAPDRDSMVSGRYITVPHRLNMP